MLAAALFCSCDKDDAPCPVTDISIPTSSAENPIQPGSAVTIQGKGFTDASEIWLQGTSRTAEVRVEITAVSTTALTFTAPEVSGKQTVVLKQDGETWSLGKLYFPEAPDEGDGIAILPKKLVKVEMTVQDEEYTKTYTTKYTYDESGRLSKIDMGKDNGVYEIEYAANEIIMRDLFYGDRTTFRLENNRATTCVEEEKESGYSYTCKTEYSYGRNDYLSGYVYTLTERGETYTGKGTLTIGEDGYLKTFSENCTIEFIPNKKVRNNLNLDLMGNSDFMEIIDNRAIRNAYLLGIGGKRTTYLPQQITIKDENEGENDSSTLKYDYIFDGDYLSEIRRLDDRGITIKLYYEK